VTSVQSRTYNVEASNKTSKHQKNASTTTTIVAASDTTPVSDSCQRYTPAVSNGRLQS